MDTVLITGASRGLGRALVTAFERRGSRVLAHRRDEIGDLRDPEVVDGLRQVAEQQNVNILINNAGVYSNEWLDGTSAELLREIVEVNLIAPMLITKALWPLLKQ